MESRSWSRSKGVIESELSWSQVLLNLQGRGLELGSKLSVGDGALCWDGRYVSLLKTLASTNLLVLDDWGLKSFSAEQQYALNNTELIRTLCAHALKNLRVPNHMSTELPSDAAQLDLPNLDESLFL